MLPILALVLPGLLGCSGDGEDVTTVQVLAAASLTEVFTGLAEDFEADHPGVDVELVLGSSTDLAEMAADGAPGDVLATADEASMQVALDAGVTSTDPAVFAENRLVIVTSPGNPDGIDSLDDLAGVVWVRCADDVPCGRVALSLLEGAGVSAEPVSLEVDAGLVYASDAVSAGDAVEVVPIQGADEVPAVYHVAPLAQSVDADLASDWVALVRSDEGRAALDAAGFSVP